MGGKVVFMKGTKMQIPLGQSRALHILLGTAAVVTGMIHLALGANFWANPGDAMFLLNGAGFLGLAALYLLPLMVIRPDHETIRWVLVGYSALTIVLWVVMNGKLEGVGIAAKLAEIVIIAVMLLDRPR